MTLAELKTELAARGFDYISATRASYFLNRSYSEMCEERDWPFLLTTQTGTMPMAITDLRTVQSVVDTTQKKVIKPLVVPHLLAADTDLTTAGSPSNYYVTSTGISVYPTSTTDQFSVRYFKVPAELTNDADTPVGGTRFHNLIVDGACIYAYADSDNFDSANAMRAQWNEGKDRMAKSLLHQQHDRPDRYVVMVAGSEDGGW